MKAYKQKIRLGFERIVKDGIVIHTVPSFVPYVDYVFCGEKQDMSFKVIRDAKRQDVLQSYGDVCDALGMPFEKVVMTNIVHGDTVLKVDDALAGRGVFLEEPLPACDGLMTNVPGIPMATTHADCVPIAYYDPVQNAGCVVHAGWRGVLANLPMKAIAAMESEYGSKPNDMLVAIGPFIKGCCFEVDEDVAAQFACAFPQVDSIIPGGEKERVDLEAILLYQMENAGIQPEHMTMDGRCSCCEESLHSFRREKVLAGTMVQIMQIRSVDRTVL